MKRLLTVILVVTGFSALAQQKIQLSQYMMNQFLLNPGVAGTSGAFELASGYRMQWVGLEGAPRTFYLTFHGPLTKSHERYNWKNKKNHHHSIGAYISRDKAGLLSRTLAYAAYAFNQPLSKKLRISVGVLAGVQQHKIEGSEVVMNGYDPSLPETDITELVPDVSIGAWLYTEDFYIGLSSMQILRNRLDYSINNPLSGETGRLSHHWYLTGGVDIPIYYDWEFIPSALLKYAYNAPLTFDLNAKFRYQEKYWAGVSYRHFDAVAAMIGIAVVNNALNIGYSFDYPVSDLSPFTHGSHEIMVSYILGMNSDVLSPQMFW